MKFINLAANAIAIITFISCNDKAPAKQEPLNPQITGTWELVSSKTIEKEDTTITFPEKDVQMIKILNNTHFAFFKHDTGKRKSPPVFVSGSGTYSLSGENYKEHLEYCNYREWENHDFDFKLSFRNDTLIQQGFEKIDSLNINREIIEIYIKKK